jgi:hypothetical protein
VVLVEPSRCRMIEFVNVISVRLYDQLVHGHHTNKITYGSRYNIDHSILSEPQEEMHVWRKKIEMIGIDIKSLDQNMDKNRFKLKTMLIYRHFLNELAKIGLEFVNITGTFDGKLMVLLEAKAS